MKHFLTTVVAAVSCVAAALVGMSGSRLEAAGAVNAAASTAAVAATAFVPAAWTDAQVGSITPSVLNLALAAASCAVKSGDVAMPRTLTVIDYSRPSTSKRLWVFDLSSRTLLNEELVAHGQGSGDNVATKFSNNDESHQSSIGLFVTKDTYLGKHGLSLRLQGLDTGFNDHALTRDIVVHGAPYVSDDAIRAQGRLGRSWGCPAVREGVVREVIDRIKGGNLIFAYYPDPSWLETSKYLSTCAAAAPKP